jgi:uncharacterized membrane protein
MWIAFLVHWLHIFSGIFWFGSILYLAFVLIPALTRLPLEQQQGSKVALDFVAQRQRVKLFVMLELVGFLVIFTCMVLMRFEQ